MAEVERRAAEYGLPPVRWPEPWPGVLAAASEAGLDPGEVASGLADPEVTERLRAATAAAGDRGVFGVPTVAVGERLFWGDDRLEEAAAALC